MRASGSGNPSPCRRNTPTARRGVCNATPRRLGHARSYYLSTPRDRLPLLRRKQAQHRLWFVFLKLLRFPLFMSYPLILRCFPHRRIIDLVPEHVRFGTSTG